MENIIRDIMDLIEDCFYEKYGEINWRNDAGMQKRIMEREVSELQFDVCEQINDRFVDLDKDISDWECDHQESWDKEDLQNLKIDMLYEQNNDK